MSMGRNGSGLGVYRSIRRVVVCGLFGLTAIMGGQAQGAEAKPNIVLVLADDLGVGDVGSYNADSQIPTPHLDRLAESGRMFTDAHAPGSVCVPTRYGLLTGEFPFREDWRRWNKEAVIDPGQTTVATLLRDAGYKTAMIGKWHLGFEGGNAGFGASSRLQGGPVDHGFAYYFGMHASLDIPPYFYIRNAYPVAAPTARIKGNRSEKEVWNRIQGPFWRGGGIAPGLRLDGVLPRWREETVAFLERHRRREPERPFFLYCALTAPHTPWLPLEEYEGKSQAGMYGDFVAQVDDWMGTLLETLERLDWTEETLVIFMSDNGPVWYAKDVERFGHRSTSIYRGMKGDIWEGGHRMPFIVRWPGHVPAGTESDVTLGFTDLPATFAALVGEELETDEAVDSYNRLPAFLGRPDRGEDQSELIHSAIGFHAIRRGKWKLIPGLGSGGFSEPRRREPGPDEPKGQLYNLETDPGETENLYDERPKVVERLSKRLERYLDGYSAAGEHR